jgi:hypothetical protein
MFLAMGAPRVKMLAFMNMRIYVGCSGLGLECLHVDGPDLDGLDVGSHGAQRPLQVA